MRPRGSQLHTSMFPEPRVLDVVELQATSGRWPAGTEGTVLETKDSRALVEIADDRGHTLDIVEIPTALLRPLAVPHQEHLAV
jgi:hypothetical protein